MSLLDSANRDSYCYYMDILTEGIQNKYPHVTEMISREEVTMDISGEVDLILEVFNTVEDRWNSCPKEVQDELSADYHLHF